MTEEWVEEDGDIVRDILGRGLTALSKLNPEGRLTLDISVYSPSDSEHHFRNIAFHPADQRISDTTFDFCVASNAGHGWVDGTTAPAVPAATNLLFRRQTRRRWEPNTLGPLIGCFPNLEELHYEPWREWGRLLQGFTDMGLKQLFKTLTVNTLKKIVIFEDLNESLIAVNSTGICKALDAEPVRTACAKVSAAFAAASLSLEHISAAFMIDASLFWTARQSDWVWENLLSLSLTSRKLAPEALPASINEMLYAAAQTATKMPKLKIMELWNGGLGHASVFRYENAKAGTPARITWRSSWDLQLDPRVTQAWKTMAGKHRIWEFEVRNEPLGSGEFLRSHGDAIKALTLVNEVACPVSLSQIRRENIR
ncbi:hypothetical protein K491DRAFT_779808 [Lophiostoma macrostomum CBS 122681]|uniref:DUF6546 domain-containing protein n=1 Tax=Lophiostoma macrostomum CBS 122681 TaxID=1314788 RepID=A0A6A6T2D8_9PLEO|nr:hypothetical protein K491DRAFT_779808 [Lophiostoma macrostomum CBS 122681]